MGRSNSATTAVVAAAVVVCVDVEPVLVVGQRHAVVHAAAKVLHSDRVDDHTAAAAVAAVVAEVGCAAAANNNRRCRLVAQSVVLKWRIS